MGTIPPAASDAPAVAIVGLAGRFPGARNIAELWANLRGGREAISRFTTDQLEDDFDVATRSRPDYVAARSILSDADMFDADFFSMMPRDAELTDPQQRVFLECCWEALEAAGCDPAAFDGAIGVYAGASLNTYLLRHVGGDRARISQFTSDYQVGSYAELVGALPDFLATRVAYKLDLRGPAVTLASACSTSLLAVTQACQALLNNQCDIALAGGVSITLPQARGYIATEGGLASTTGRCRPFDAAADGTVFGSGAGVVVLKRLEDALANNDHIWGVVCGFGVNNDGGGKAGFSAPSVHGQASVIEQSLAMAGIPSDAIGYVETHGTGTPLGDPIEFAALVQAFRATSDKTAHCRLGSTKANLGHLDAAAGVVGLIKTLLVLEHEIVPGLLHFDKPNPHLKLAGSPFTLSASMQSWSRQSEQPRYAGVSAFGVGGTNVHVTVREAPARAAANVEGRAVLLPVSARTEQALTVRKADLAAALTADGAPNLGDVAWTLQAGRRAFQHRFACVAGDASMARKALAASAGTIRAQKNLEVAFLFPGQGAQHAGMARDLYTHEPVFRATFDRCNEILDPILQTPLQSLLREHGAPVDETWFAQPAIFSVSYALAALWDQWGVRPAMMVGHSVGEFVSACRAGVLSLEDSLKLVAARGRLMQALPRGRMLSVRCAPDALVSRLSGTLSVAAVNGPQATVIAGPTDEIYALSSLLESEAITCRLLPASHAFHSAMMEPAVAPFRELVRSVRLEPPKIPIISTLTGEPLSVMQATDPDYWARHMRETVAFAAAVSKLRANKSVALVEVGPGTALSQLARQNPGLAEQLIVSSMPASGSSEAEHSTLLKAAGRLWEVGCELDWSAMSAANAVPPRRVPLPTYPFERRRHWIDRPQASAETVNSHPTAQPHIGVKPTKSGLTEMAPTASLTMQPAAVPALRQAVETRLLEIFERVSGRALSASEHSLSFLDLGFDSLLLTQAARAIQSSLGVKIAFRQLMDEQGSLASLADWIETRAPKIELPTASAPSAPARLQPPLMLATSSPGSNAATTAFSPASPAAIPSAANAQTAAPVSGSGAELLMREQLQLFGTLVSSQLEALKSLGASNIGAATTPLPLQTPVQSLAPPLQIATLAPAQANISAAAPTAVASFGPFNAARAKSASGLTPHQKAHLDALVERMTKRAPKSKAQTQAHRQRLADPRVAAGFRNIWKEIVYPVVVDRSKGSRLWDVDGNEYIDLLNGFGPIMFGHRPDFVEKALSSQLAEGLEIGPQTPLAGEVAELFCDMTGNERMTFCNTGSEAVMAAFRLARTVTGRDRIVMFAGDYHGMFDEVLVTAGGGRPNARPIAPGIPPESNANVTVLDYGTADALAWIRANAHDLAAVIVEPVQSRRPDFQPVQFLKDLREVTRASGTALIFDEIVTGFRSHPGGCQALFGIRADLATYGKVLGGGMPIGVLAGRAEFMDALDGGAWTYGDASVPEVGVTFFAGTFVRHPLTLSVVKAVLKELAAQGPALQERLTARTAALVGRINGVFEHWGVPARVAYFSSVMFFRLPAEERLAGLFYYLLRERGIHASEGFPCFLTTAHSDADIDQIVAAFESAARQMAEAHFFENARTVAVLQAPALQPTCKLTEPQREVFLAAMLDPAASTAFNESVAVHLHGSLNIESLRTALVSVVARHEALRARVDADGERLVIAPELDVPLVERDLSPLDETARNRAYRTFLDLDARNAFDMHKAPLIRWTLLKLDKAHHALVMTAHHIVCDGWSTNVILEELAALYSAQAKAEPVKLPEAHRFTDYARTRETAATSIDGRSTEAYWLALYKDKPQPIDLPTDRPRGSARSFAGATARHQMPAEFASLCRKFAAGEKSSLFMVLLAGFNALLAKLSNSTDIVVGVPTAGQSAIESGNLVGHCVDFLPVRTTVANTATFRSLLKATRDRMLEATDHQSYTYGTLVRKLAMPRHPGRLPLMEVHFNLEQIGRGANFAGLTATIEPNAKTGVNPDLFLNLVDSENEFAAYCDYNTDLYDEATIQRWMKNYTELLAAAMAAPDHALAGLFDAAPTVTTAVALTQITEWNRRTTVSYPAKAIVTLFEEQARTTPDHIAVAQGDITLSYEALNTRANWYAHQLIGMDIGRGMRVGICVGRTPEMLAALLGILKTGAAYVPLDPTHPQDRLSFILSDAKVAAIIIEENLQTLVEGQSARRLALDAGASSRSAHANPGIDIVPTDPAYYMFTSGTTGRPKGVPIHHGALVNLLVFCTRELECRPDDVFAAIATISFDISCIELFLPLLVGARIEVVPSAATTDGDQLVRLISERAITLFQATPATWRMLLNTGWEGAPGMRAISTAEPLPRDIAEGLLPRVAKLWNGYGPTETTVWSTIEQVRTIDEPITIGRPIANTQIHIVGQDGRALGVGEVGELWIGGDGVASGYLNRPELTAERFVQHNHGLRYRTGDLARWLPDGRLLHLGRIDHQVKIRGVRIELGEIESVIQEVRDVRQAVVVADKSEGSERLVAFCTTAPAAVVTQAKIMQHAASKLPGYMLPVSLIILEALPLSPNGKIDRIRLLEIEREQRSNRDIVEPETVAERKLLEIVKLTLAIDRVGVTDNLFELGIDSLKIFQIVSRANKESLGVTPRMLMLKRSVRAAIAEAAKTPQSAGVRMMEIKAIPREKLRRTPV